MRQAAMAPPSATSDTTSRYRRGRESRIHSPAAEARLTVFTIALRDRGD